MRIPDSDWSNFILHCDFSVFILGVSFLQGRETPKRWLEFSVFSIEKETEIWMSHFEFPISTSVHMARLTGFEPAAYRVGVCHSIQLSYGRILGCGFLQ